MKLYDLKMHCGDCPIIDYCNHCPSTPPCAQPRFENITVLDFKSVIKYLEERGEDDGKEKPNGHTSI